MSLLPLSMAGFVMSFFPRSMAGLASTLTVPFIADKGPERAMPRVGSTGTVADVVREES